MRNMFSIEWNAVGAVVRKKGLPASILRKVSLLVCFFLVLSAQQKIAAQASLGVSGLQKDASAATWHLLKAEGGVSVYYQLLSCGPVDHVFFKVENTGAAPVQVSWSYEVIKNGAALESNPDDANVKFEVAGGAAINGACSGGLRKLRVFARESGSNGGIETIKLNNLSITSVQ
ncbi:MAG: hypothetical protein EOO16_08665 [Chitinophagaceae bacterium]|nr:MAG: hypothetical protein EOO16_08665 [Chitinophagaceae bacterium]